MFLSKIRLQFGLVLNAKVLQHSAETETFLSVSGYVHTVPDRFLLPFKIAPIECEQKFMFCSGAELFRSVPSVNTDPIRQFATFPFDFKRSFTSTRFRCNFSSDKVFRIKLDRFKNLSDIPLSTAERSSTVPEQKLLRKQRS